MSKLFNLAEQTVPLDWAQNESPLTNQGVFSNRSQRKPLTNLSMDACKSKSKMRLPQCSGLPEHAHSGFLYACALHLSKMAWQSRMKATLTTMTESHWGTRLSREPFLLSVPAKSLKRSFEESCIRWYTTPGIWPLPMTPTTVLQPFTAFERLRLQDRYRSLSCSKALDTCSPNRASSIYSILARSFQPEACRPCCAHGCLFSRLEASASHCCLVSML